MRVKKIEEGIIKKGRYKIKTMDVEYLSDVHYKNGKTLNQIDVLARFSTSQINIERYIDENLLFITTNNGLRRDVAEEEIGKRKSITDLLLSDWGDNQESDNEMRELFNQLNFFDYTKPSLLIRNLIKSCYTSDETILDFFSGSATTAQAVLKINEDGGNRKFIMVQLPEPTDAKSDAFLAGYKNIASLGKERIRRAAKKIAADNPMKNLDLGFKVFKLDSSNIKSWDGSPEILEQSLFDAQDNIKTDRSEEDILFEILLKYGLDLSMPLEERIIEGKKVYNVGSGTLFICLANEITSSVAEGIGKWKEQIQPETSRVIFKDAGFTDIEKTNSVHVLKRFGIHEIKSI